jgi:uncharacterized protein (TIGR02599 family)
MDLPLLFRNERLSSAKMASVRGFTLVEMLVASAILLIIFGVLFYLIQVSSGALKTSTTEVQAFQAARNAFESMTRNISLATLNNYYDYTDNGVTLANTPAGSTFQPTGYLLTSDLHFISGPGLLTNPAQVTHAIFFQAPLGYSNNSDTATLNNYTMLDNMLNACGYFIEYSAVSTPSFLPGALSHSRYQLMEFMQPTESLTVYNTTAGSQSASDTWFTTDLGNPASTDVHPIASNIIALVIEPRNSSADSVSASSTAPIVGTGYAYDTRNGTVPAQINQLPPVVQIVMVAMDEASALKLGDTVMKNDVQTALSQPRQLFTTVGSTQALTDQALQADLQSLETNLTGDKINYAVFQTQVALRSAKLISP